MADWTDNDFKQEDLAILAVILMMNDEEENLFA
jgi:hypothetical protein